MVNKRAFPGSARALELAEEMERARLECLSRVIPWGTYSDRMGRLWQAAESERLTKAVNKLLETAFGLPRRQNKAKKKAEKE